MDSELHDACGCIKCHPEQNTAIGPLWRLLMDRDLERARLDIEAIIYDKRPDLVQPYLDVVEAARKYANPDYIAARDRIVPLIAAMLDEGRKFTVSHG